jgi:hypothetical protein
MPRQVRFPFTLSGSPDPRSRAGRAGDDRGKRPQWDGVELPVDGDIQCTAGRREKGVSIYI